MIATRTALDSAIGGLPDLYRAAVVLRDVEDLPYAVPTPGAQWALPP